jgi:hypothetical protein
MLIGLDLLIIGHDHDIHHPSTRAWNKNVPRTTFRLDVRQYVPLSIAQDSDPRSSPRSQEETGLVVDVS